MRPRARSTLFPTNSIARRATCGPSSSARTMSANDSTHYRICALAYRESAADGNLAYAVVLPQAGRRLERRERYEAKVNQAFLATRFTRSATQLRNYVREDQNGNYRVSPLTVPYPRNHGTPSFARSFNEWTENVLCRPS